MTQILSINPHNAKAKQGLKALGPGEILSPDSEPHQNQTNSNASGFEPPQINQPVQVADTISSSPIGRLGCIGIFVGLVFMAMGALAATGGEPAGIIFSIVGIVIMAVGFLLNRKPQKAPAYIPNSKSENRNQKVKAASVQKQTPQEVDIPKPQFAFIDIKRKSKVAHGIRKFGVFIDGKKAGTIGNGAYERFQVSFGNHSVYVKVDFSKSKVVIFTLHPGETINLICASGLRPSLKRK